jgi:hypothetical protein
LKRYFLGVLLTVLALSGSELQNAIKDYEEKRYENAYNTLSRLSFLSMKSSAEEREQIDFYLGRTAFELGRYSEAMFAFERVLIERPDHLRSRLELGRTLYMLRELESAEIELKTIISEHQDSLPEEVVLNVSTILMDIELQKMRYVHKFDLSLSLESGYDTNVGANPTDAVMDNYLGESSSNYSYDGVVESLYLNELLNLGYTYDFGDEGDYSLQSALFLYNQNFSESSDYETVYGSILTTPTLTKRRYRLQFPLQVDKLYYGGNDLMHSYRGGFQFQYSPADRTLLSFTSSYRNKFYKELNRDSQVFETGGAISKTIFGGHNLQLSVNYQREEPVEEITADNQVDKDITAVKLRLRENIFDFYTVELSYLYRYLSYRNYSAEGVDQVKEGLRADEQKNIYLSLQRELNKNLSLQLSYNRIDNSSNHLPIEYSKSIYSLSLNLNY